MNLIINSAV